MPPGRHGLVGCIGLTLLGSVAVAAAGAAAAAAVAPWERREFTDSRNPPSYLELSSVERERVDLGHAVFNTQWVAAGTPNSARHDGLGPLYTAAACDACHNEGAHGRGPAGDGRLPGSMIVQLRDRSHRDAGDPRYGRTLSTAALDGFMPEAVITIRYQPRVGHYPDGQSWELREPHYQLGALALGPLAASTVVQPRLAPALFGAGLLAAVRSAPGARFGWQSDTASLLAQTSKALAQDMGITSSVVTADDCTRAERACRAAANGGVPEIDPELLQALIEFQRTLAVPAARVEVQNPPAVFQRMGCGGCHRPAATITSDAAAGGSGDTTIYPYTDLKRHDLGAGLADHDASDNRVASRWRTAPLWGMAYRLSHEKQPTFLHDGRARSLEEAILWHDGAAAAARRRFEHSPAAERQELIAWVSGL